MFGGEFPYGSSFSIGLLGTQILRFIERDLKRGLSPSIFLHPYELVKPPSSARLTRDLILNPHLVPFLRDKSGFLKSLLKHFPVSPLGTYLDEMLASPLNDCMLCGCCSYVCPSNIPLSQQLAAAKVAIRQRKTAA